MADQVTCESKDNKRAECNMNTQGRIQVVKQLSKTACVENQNWGANKSSIWVSGGCRAIFRSESANSSGQSSRPVPQEPTPAHISACNARMPGDGDVESFEALTPGSWSIILNYRGRRFSCDVDGQGRVDGFQELAAGGGASNSAPDAAIRGCNRFANEGYDGTVESQTALKPGYWEVIMRFEEYRYVCNVNDRGEVSEFNKLR
jgi:hypothetical protein